jgi:vacuolar protein sorting-associated protein 13A/C
MDLAQPGTDKLLRFISSAESNKPQIKDQDLLSVSYTRVQKESPEFLSVYEGINQSVDIKISTFVFRAAPEPVISLYDFVMTTFVPQSNTQPSLNTQLEILEKSEVDATVEAASISDGKIRVLVKLARVQGQLASKLNFMQTCG